VTTTTLYLLRHAKSTPSPRVAEASWPLSTLGELQARGLTARLQALQLHAIYSSPYLRARQSVEPFAAAASLPIEIVPALHERALPWMPELDAFFALARRCFEEPGFAPQGFESNRQAARRMERGVASLLERHPGRRVLLSGHGMALSCYLNTLDPSFGYHQWRAMENPDLYRVELDQSGALVGAVARVAIEVGTP